MSEDTQLPLASPDPAADLLAQLRAAAPQVFGEGRVDFDRLRAALGEHVDTGPERYGLSWAGKADAFRNVRAPSVGTLLPMLGDSVNWDRSENLIIEGDNLEVLKLLQKSYHGKVKMIYIDPPYNTGNDFIYPDNYRQGLEDYLRFSGQVDEEGAARSTNRDSSGRYHSDWLSMMYPRLFLARNLLRDDGAIFITIDDNEVHNLRMLMNEIFGEENFIANIVWQKKQSPQNDAINFSDMHDHILVYARRAKQSKVDTDGWQIKRLPREDDQENRYENPDADPRGPWTSSDMTCNKTADERPNLYFAIKNPHLDKEIWPNKTRVWGYEKQVVERLLAENRLWWGKNGNNVPRLKIFRSEVNDGVVPASWWPRDKAGDNQEARREIRALFPENDVFDTPKPARLIKRMLQVSTSGSTDAEIVLDFFGGSGTTAEAVMELNNQDQGNRRFILVQLPEKTNIPEFATIADVTRERVRRVIAKHGQEGSGKKSACGFRAFKLSSSNFRIWNAERTPDDPAKLAEQLQLYANNSDHARSEQDVLYELILKSGLPLSCKVAPVTVAGVTVWSVDDNHLLILLNKSVSREVLRAMIALQPQQMLCLDAAFNGDDALKTSIVLETKSHGITFRTV